MLAQSADASAAVFENPSLSDNIKEGVRQIGGELHMLSQETHKTRDQLSDIVGLLGISRFNEATETFMNMVHSFEQGNVSRDGVEGALGDIEDVLLTMTANRNTAQQAVSGVIKARLTGLNQAVANVQTTIANL